ncbi:MAG: isoprenyl transferase [Oscillospiraceae bacterium]|nr:isoprenyl transferase [Oscillospiraceae bacterium]
MGIFKKKQVAESVDFSALPQHIAIILDGNGRWAKRRGLPRTAGHAVGSETFRKVATYCNDIGIKYLTVYAFSTENWKRPVEEVDTIMSLLEKYILEAIDEVRKKNLILKFWGSRDGLSERIKKLMDESEKESADMTGMQVNVCLNYGSRNEITNAVRLIAADVSEGRMKIEDITEAEIEKRLYSAGTPAPDLLIRPGGEMRLSNYLLWQTAYSEFVFSDKLWPDFDERELDRAIIEYQKRNRRFGGI